MENILDTATTVLPLLLLLAVVMVFLRWSQRNLRASAQRIKRFERPSNEDLRRGHALDAPPNVARWEIEMHDLARDLQGQLDSKIVILNQLIRTADAQIARLEQALQLPGQERPPSASWAATSASHASSDGITTADSAVAAPKPVAPSAQQSEIYSLADAGYNSAAIAQRIGTPQGEVELVLSLREKH